ncbi:winged helix-turn-helix transcriptional regulator [Microbacterium sp. 69-10]|uniref:winged helix-turn-helix transcriptional regulator n=1 Tax=Microbacterium sp. 69-10 TaxID=1895783 RepID=UPI0025FCFB52|nr:winged helix-turn-helix transcriptional regulator [Microbacterium sp. 69-10]
MEKDRVAGEKSRREKTRRGADGRRYSPTRERILLEIEANGPATTAEVVSATSLHENTVREHLERLRQDGRLRRIRARAQGRGRPGWRWEALRPDVVNPYAGLALALADSLAHASADSVAHARSAGVRWGSTIAAERTDAEEQPRALVMDLMREQGFDPEDSSRDDAIILRRCPLLAAAARRTDVVCAVHEGMVTGIVRSRDAGADAELLPLRPEGGCLLHLRAAS